MRKPDKYLKMFLVCFLIIWSLVILYFAIDFSDTKTFIPAASGGDSRRQEEYHMLVLTDPDSTGNRIILNIEYVISNKLSIERGTAHLSDFSVGNIQNVEWFSTKLSPGDFVVTNTPGENALLNDVVFTKVIGNRSIKLHALRIPMIMTIRAQDDFAKFGGQSTCILSIDGEDKSCKIALTKGYNEQDIILDINKYGIHTDWALFWDSQGNLHHIDKTILDKVHENYFPHSFYGIMSNNYSVTFNDIKNIDYSKDLVTITYEDSSGSFSKDYSLSSSYENDIEGYYKYSLLHSDEGSYGIYLRIN